MDDEIVGVEVPPWKPLNVVAELSGKVVDMMAENVIRIQDGKGRMYFIDSSHQLYRAIPLKGKARRLHL